MLVVGVDVGSIRRKGGFSWATAAGDPRGADDPRALGRQVAQALDRDVQVALSFECPLSIPTPMVSGDSWQQLGRARTGEGNRSWSAGAGTGALATGLVQLAWLCRYLTVHCHAAPQTTTQLDRFSAGAADLLIAEAMVTAEGKPEPVGELQDHADAVAAAKRLEEVLTEYGSGGTVSDVYCAPHVPLNLAATAALHAGLDIDVDELRLEVVVAKVRPVIFQ